MQREDLVDLNAFIAIAEDRSFTRASARLGISPSALSHAMRRLESRVGVRLLTRTTRSVAPTDVGDRLLSTLRPSLARIEEELGSIASLREKPAGNIRITAAQHAVDSVLWPVLATLLPSYPDLHVELSVDSGLTDIVSQRFDAGVRLGEALAKDMIAVPIGPDLRMAVVGAPDYLANHGTPHVPNDLASHRCINLRMLTGGGFYAWELEKGGRELRVRVDGQLAFDSVPMVIRAAEAGFGLCFVMEDQVAEQLGAKQLVRVLEDWCQPFPGYHLYYPSRRQPSAAFTLVVDALRQARTNDPSR